MGEAPGAGRAAFAGEDHARRIDRAGAAARAAGLAGLLVTPGPDLTWLTGYRPPAAGGRLTLLVVTPDGASVLLVPSLDRPDAEAAAGISTLTLCDWRDGTDPYGVAAALLSPRGCYGLSDSAWAAHLLGLQRELPGASYVALGDCLPMLRAVKDAAELDRIAAAGAAADRAYELVRHGRFSGRTERAVAAELADLLVACGHEEAEVRVGSGPNGAHARHRAGDRVIVPGDVVVLDFGGLCNGYASDVTRTVCVGEPSEDAVEVHAIVAQAQQEAFAAVRPGVPCGDVDEIARAVITEAGFGDLFVHGTGHGVGVTTREPPYLVRSERHPLMAGMCVAIEPGIYLPGEFGVRIEDTVTVTADGARRNNTAGHELAIVDRR
ncbi:M24 family metallopeptidase [Pseudonocardia sp.]|uniref:M24 family metallopeptidase n=1 Tax=Pseudonocardia sp. TaxID=60912 RepID=UPI003D14F9DB